MKCLRTCVIFSANYLANVLLLKYIVHESDFTQSYKDNLSSIFLAITFSHIKHEYFEVNNCLSNIMIVIVIDVS